MPNLGGLGVKEIIIIVGVLILLFGAKKIPELARSLAESVRILRGGFRDDDKDKNN